MTGSQRRSLRRRSGEAPQYGEAQEYRTRIGACDGRSPLAPSALEERHGED